HSWHGREARLNQIRLVARERRAAAEEVEPFVDPDGAPCRAGRDSGSRDAGDNRRDQARAVPVKNRVLDYPTHPTFVETTDDATYEHLARRTRSRFNDPSWWIPEADTFEGRLRFHSGLW